MAYRLELEEGTIPEAVRAVAVEQLADAVRNLREERTRDPVTAVHEARKDLKKTRSVLRLVRAGMPSEARREVNGALRAIAADLAGVRDADVMVDTAAGLHERFAGQVPARAFTTVKRRFATQAARSREAADGLISDDVVNALESELAGVEAWPLDKLDRAALVEGIMVAYARGRDEFRASRKKPSVEGLHEWRKRVKDLWYQSKLLEASYPGIWVATADTAHELSNLLGDDHDLGVLAERIAEQEWPASVETDRFVDFCHTRRAELQNEAFALGALLYAEKPKAFARRVRAYLAA